MKYISLQLGDMPTNSYIVYDENSGSAVIVDPAANCPRILRTLEKYGLMLKYILLTHGHADHILAVNELRDATGALLAIHKNDAELLSNYEHNYSLAIFGEVCNIEKTPDIILSGGETLCCDGLRFSVMHTPGHTAGSCVYIIEDIMLSGDTLFAGGYGRTDLYGGSTPDLKKSIEKLFSLDRDYKLLPGHGYETTLFAEKRMMRF